MFSLHKEYGMQFPPQKQYFNVHFINLLIITITKSMNGSNSCYNWAAIIYFLNIESLTMTTTFSDEAPPFIDHCWQRKTNIHSLFMESTTRFTTSVFTEFEKRCGSTKTLDTFSKWFTYNSHTTLKYRKAHDCLPIQISKHLFVLTSEEATSAFNSIYYILDVMNYWIQVKVITTAFLRHNDIRQTTAQQ